MVEGAARWIFGKADRSGRIGLGVAIDEERGLACCGKAGRQIHGRSCFSYSAFLVGNRDDSGHGTPAIRESSKGG